MTTEELDQALHDLFEGQLRGAALAELNRELRENPLARESYHEHHMLHHCLRYRSKGTDLTRVVPMDQIVQRRQRKAMKQAMLATAAVLTIAALILALLMAKAYEPTLTFEVSPGTQLMMSHDLSSGESPKGQAMQPGSRLTLESGTVELKFASGVHAIIQSPANLTLMREDLLNLSGGTAWFDVPADAVGFQVVTPDLVLTDLGTSFGILSRPESADQVHVFKGKVEVLNRKQGKSEQILTAGQARTAASDGSWKEIELNTEEFLTTLPTSNPAQVQLMDSATFTSSPKNQMVRGPYTFRVNEELHDFSARGADKLVVTLSYENGAIEEVTFEGVRMSPAVSGTSKQLNTAIYYLDAPPPSGNLEVRTKKPTNGVGGSILALTNTRSGKPHIIASETGQSMTVKTLASNSMLVASLVNNEGDTNSQAAANEPLLPLFSGPCGSSAGASGYALIRKPHHVTLSFRGNNELSGIVAAVFEPTP